MPGQFIDRIECGHELRGSIVHSWQCTARQLSCGIVCKPEVADLRMPSGYHLHTRLVSPPCPGAVFRIHLDVPASLRSSGLWATTCDEPIPASR